VSGQPMVAERCAAMAWSGVAAGRGDAGAVLAIDGTSGVGMRAT
jgi:hypothetical protein